MKQRVQYIFYYENKIDYHPDIMAVFHVSHDYRGECNITLGIGAYDNPDSTKSFNGFTYDGGNAPFVKTILLSISPNLMSIKAAVLIIIFWNFTTEAAKLWA